MERLVTGSDPLHVAYFPKFLALSVSLGHLVVDRDAYLNPENNNKKKSCFLE